MLAGLVINAFAVTMLIKSGFGISVVSGVPYVLSLILPWFSLGAWNTVIQCAWLLVVIISLRRFRPGYVVSFGLAAFFGVLLNFWNGVLMPLPDGLLFHLFYFVVGYCMISTGVALLMRCKLPVLPFDTVPREFVLVKKISIRTARTYFDVSNLILVLLLSFTFLGRLEGVGVGSVFCAVFLGTGAGIVARALDRLMVITPRVKWLERLA